MYREINITPHPRRKERELSTEALTAIKQLHGKKSYILAVRVLAESKNFSLTTMRTSINTEIKTIKELVNKHCATDIIQYLSFDEALKNRRKISGVVEEIFEANLHESPKKRLIADLEQAGAWTARLAAADKCCREYAKGNFYLLKFPAPTKDQPLQTRAFPSFKAVSEFLIKKYRVKTLLQAVQKSARSAGRSR